MQVGFHVFVERPWTDSCATMFIISGIIACSSILAFIFYLNIPGIGPEDFYLHVQILFGKFFFSKNES